jgi:hypothetical protein
VAAMFVGSEADARAAVAHKTSASDDEIIGSLSAAFLANTTASTTVAIRIGADVGTTNIFGDHNAGAPQERYGGTTDYVQKGMLIVEEMFV